MLPPPNSLLLYPQLDPLLLPCQYDLLGGLDLDSPIGLLPPDPRDPAFAPMGPELGLVSPVPEPSTLALLAVAAAIVVRRRK